MSFSRESRPPISSAGMPLRIVIASFRADTPLTVSSFSKRCFFPRARKKPVKTQRIFPDVRMDVQRNLHPPLPAASENGRPR